MSEKLKVGDTVKINSPEGHFLKLGSLAKVVELDLSYHGLHVLNGISKSDNRQLEQILSENQFTLISNIQTNKTMVNQIMKAALLVVANRLLKANNTVTTLELKVELRKTDPEFYWDQATVSKIMAEYEQDGLFTYQDNGTYRVYSEYPSSQLPTIAVTTQVATATAVPVKTATRKVKISKTTLAKITRKKALELMQNNKGHFFTATFVKKDNTVRTINCQYMKDQTNSDLGYVKVKETTKLKNTPTDCIRQINLQTLQSLKIAGTTYSVR